MGKVKYHYMAKAEEHGDTVYLACQILQTFPDLYKSEALKLSIVEHMSTAEAQQKAWNDAFDKLCLVIAPSADLHDIQDAYSWLITADEDPALHPKFFRRR